MSAAINKTHVPKGKKIVEGWEAKWYNVTDHHANTYEFPKNPGYTNFVKNIDFLMTKDFKEASDNMISDKHISAIFKTNFIVEKGGEYTFQLSTEDKGKAFLDGKLLINNW